MGNCAGIDWASEKHDVLIEDPSGGELLATTFGALPSAPLWTPSATAAGAHAIQELIPAALRQR